MDDPADRHEAEQALIVALDEFSKQAMDTILLADQIIPHKALEDLFHRYQALNKCLRDLWGQMGIEEPYPGIQSPLG